MDDTADVVEAVLNEHRSWECMFSVHSNVETHRGYEEEVWEKFYRHWWKSASSLSGSVLKVDQPDMLVMLPLLRSSAGNIIVPDEYTHIYDQISRLPERATGARITGQPGIGKSYFGVYATLRRMAQGEPVLFTTSYGSSYLFDKDGVWGMRSNAFRSWHISLKDEDTLWSIVDAAASREVHLPLLCATSSLGILLCSPEEEDGYKRWWRDHCVQRIVMNAWNMDELRTLLSYPECVPVPLEADMNAEMLVAQAGPCPGDIFNFMDDPAKIKEEIDRAMYAIESVKDVRGLLGRFPEVTKASQSLTLVSRSPVSDNGSDVLRADIKTRGVGRAMFDKLRDGILQKPAQLSRDLSPSRSSSSSVVTGWLFENLAHWLTSGKTSVTIMTRFDRLGRMKASPEDPHIFRYIDRSDEYAGYVVALASGLSPVEVFSRDIEISWDRRTVFSPPRAANDRFFEPSKLDQQPRDIHLPIAARERRNYQNIDDVNLTDTQYYVPESSDNSLFDSFFLEANGSSVVLWALQITIGRLHGCSTNGVQEMKTIIEKAKNDFEVMDVEVKYVVIVPKLRGLRASWEWPVDEDEWRDVAGEVYLQPLEIGVVPFDTIFYTERQGHGWW